MIVFSMLINPDTDEFREFLLWLVESKDFTAKEVIWVVFESHKYSELMTEYKEKGENGEY